MSLIPPPTPSVKPTILFGSLTGLCLIFFVSAVIVGSNTGELESKIIVPLGTFVNNTLDALKNIQIHTTESRVINNSVNINNTIQEHTVNTVTNTETNIRYINPTSTRVYVQPNYVSPTPNPTIVQQNAEFNAKWDEIKAQQEQSLRDFCQKMPSASVCN